jgi:hypothetical protein
MPAPLCAVFPDGLKCKKSKTGALSCALLRSANVCGTEGFLARVSGYSAIGPATMPRDVLFSGCPTFRKGSVQLLGNFTGVIDGWLPLEYVLEATVMHRMRQNHVFRPSSGRPGCYMKIQKMNVVSPPVQLSLFGVWPRNAAVEIRVSAGVRDGQVFVLLSTPEDF